MASAPFQFAGDSESEDDNFNPAPADLSDEEDGADHDDSPAHKKDRRGSSPAADNDHDEDEDEGDGDEPVRTSKKRAREDDDEEENAADEEEEDVEADGDGDEEELEEDDEEEEDEDDEDVQHRHRRKRRKDHRAAFFDIEAEVEDEDEAEDEERDGEEIEDFIENAHPDDIAEPLHDDTRHRELDRRREIEASMDAEKQAEILKERYGKRAHARGYNDMAVVPKRLLLPSVDDPGIWAVRCKEGKERDVIFSIMRRVEERAGTKDELAITAAFERGGPNSVMKGYIYVEARRQNDILIALDGVLDVYPRTKMILVEIKDMPDLLRVTKTPTLEPGAWVRLKRPAKHAGDLAQVLDVTENGLEARVRFIPRLDYGDKSDSFSMAAPPQRRRPGMPGPRPPQRLFSEIEARKRNPRYLSGNPQTNTWTYMGEEFENGFQVKDIKIQHLEVKDVNPTLEEVTKFASGAEDGTENLDLKALAASLKDSNSSVTYVRGDVIEVYEGEQRGVVGRAVNVQGDIVTLKVTEGELAGQTIEVPNKGLRKRFRTGDHVKVIGGSRFRDEVGMVVKIVEDRVTLLTDQTNTEITVFSKDLREASDIGGQGSLGQYSLLDLVQLDPTTVGCIVKVDRESMVVLDQNGDTKQVMPSQIANKLPKRKIAVAADRNGSEIRIDDVVREYGGQQRQGKIIHIHRSFVFLHSNATTENAGVFVTRAGNVTTIAAKGGRTTANSGPDLSTMNPALKRMGPNGPTGPMQPPKSFGRDRALGQTVSIRKGGYKGLMGIVKDTTDTHARVELHGKNKIVTVPKADLVFKDKITGKTIDIYSRGGRGGFGGGGYPGGGDRMGSRTPMGAGSGERTPAWGAKSVARTPAWGRAEGSGSRTPAWGDGSRTVNPYDGSRTAYGDGNRTAYGGATSYGGSRTPAWSSSAKTPAHDGFGHGSKTPAWGLGVHAWPERLFVFARTV
ncbi:hypothetical protein VTJ49DRAFT_6912 [Mycothermus thermophilus]|uniref:Transcription elongation factor SPT5 n=1 Tax=Humicola insolens TaxID=85995 RepID=A0ABR3V0Q8_HUMIN